MKLWVTGWGGMLGSHVYRAAAVRGHTVRGSLHKDCPIEDVARVWEIAQLWTPDAIINCGGAPPGSSPLEMVTANALGPHILATLQIRLVHMSTDCVYSGCVGAGRRPDPIDLYGRTKLAGESDAPHVLNVRGSFIGKEAGFLRWLLEAKGEVEGWTRARWNGTSVAVMAEKLVELAEGDRTGVVFAGSAIRVTKAGLIQYFTEALNLPVTMRPAREPLIYRAREPDIELSDLYAALEGLVEEIKASRAKG